MGAFIFWNDFCSKGKIVNFVCKYNRRYIMRLTVRLDSMRIHAFHGLLPQEKKVGNLFEVSVEVWFNHYPAETESEDINSTVNYAEIAAISKQVMATPCELLETVTVKIMRAICGRWRFLEGGKIKVTKLTPPIPIPMKGASVEIQW